jgi:hypothetical protein
MYVDKIEVPVNYSNVKLKLVTPPKTKKRNQPPDNDVRAPGITFEQPYRKLLMAIRTKPFVLLSGVSGTGKSWTARKIAYLTCADELLRKADCPGNFEMVRVRPDWHEPDDLLGYHTTHGGMRFHGTDLLRFMVKAWKYPHVPFFVCLDEMNLAPIEHYFSDFLSVLETGRTENGRMVYAPFISSYRVKQYSREDHTFWLQLGLEDDHEMQQHFLEKGIAMSFNLIVLGTVNMDETTRTLSTRLLDRAMVIEMKRKDLYYDLTAAAEKWEYPATFEAAELLIAPPLDRYMAYNEYPETGMRIIRQLEKLYLILDDTPFELSGRVRHDTLVYCFLHKKLAATDALPDDWLERCLDEIICMKILVRISGDADTCRPVIERLIQETAHYPVSRQKLQRMLSLLENGGYTSYW